VVYPGQFLTAQGTAHAPSAEEVAALRDFILAEALPPIVNYGYGMHGAIFKSTIDTIVFLIDDPAASSSPLPLPAFTEAAFSLRGKAVFVTVDAVAHARTIRRFFVPTSAGPLPSLPILGVYSKASHSRYLFDMRDKTGATIETEVRSVIEGTAQALRRTADVNNTRRHVHAAVDAATASASAAGRPHVPIGAIEPFRLEDAAGLVKDLSTQAFERELRADVLEDTAHTTTTRRILVVLFWAPWCVDCVSIKHVFAEIAAQHAGDSHLQFAQLDVSDNDPPSGARIPELPGVVLTRTNIIRGKVANTTMHWCCDEELGATKINGQGRIDAAALAAFVSKLRTFH